MSKADHRERHRSQSAGWLRAAVLGANEGILSTASLMLGVAAAHKRRSSLLIAGIAGLVAGASSMAAGEYFRCTPRETPEQADIESERAELRADDEGEHEDRGLDPELAKQVANQLMAQDATDESPPEPLDAAIIYATARDLVPAALKVVHKGGRVVCAGIHTSDIPNLPYELLWEERQLVSVANLTRQDGLDFLRLVGGRLRHEDH